jgi:hypothetical protein
MRYRGHEIVKHMTGVMTAAVNACLLRIRGTHVTRGQAGQTRPKPFSEEFF